MPVYAILKQDVNTSEIVQEKFNLERFGIFTRGTIKDFIKSICRDVTKRLPRDTKLREIREKMNEKENFKIIIQIKRLHRIFVITDGNYNSSVAYKLMEKCLDGGNFDDLIKEYKEWEDKDHLKKIEDELEKCNVIILEGLAQVLQRGETLSDLVEKSENLSIQTKLLFKTAKKRNSCC